MQKSTKGSPFKPLLDELETVLEREREALRKLDQPLIAECADHKLRLDRALTELSAQSPPAATDRNQLARIQRAARINQLLLVHARSCVQGALQLITGESYASPAQRSGPVTHSPVVLNLRG